MQPLQDLIAVVGRTKIETGPCLIAQGLRSIANCRCRQASGRIAAAAVRVLECRTVYKEYGRFQLIRQSMPACDVGRRVSQVCRTNEYEVPPGAHYTQGILQGQTSATPAFASVRRGLAAPARPFPAMPQVE